VLQVDVTVRQLHCFHSCLLEPGLLRGAANKVYPIRFFAVFSAIAWTFKAKFYNIYSHPICT